jgi:hypothetical protein
VRSVTVKWTPSFAAVSCTCTVIVSPACITSGFFELPFGSIALKAAGSWKTPFCPVLTIVQTGEQALYAPCTCFSTKPPFGVQLVTTPLG